MKNLIKRILLVFCISVLMINIYYFVKIVKEKKQLDDTVRSVNDSKVERETSAGMRITYAEGFYYEPVSDALKDRITGVSYKENDIIDYSDLRYLTIKYVDFDGDTQVGELLVNVQIAEDVLAIFKELYDIGYQIEKVRLIDDYNGDDDASMADNNTSAFNFRTIDGTDEISDHSYGMAIDINPLYNPYVRTGYGERDVLPVNGSIYADRTQDFEHKIVKGDECYNAFISRGFKWGGEWTGYIDYQHFYREEPS